MLNNTLYEGDTLRLAIPTYPLMEGSIKVQSKSGGRSFADWTREENSESFELMQKVVALWHKKGITNYQIIGMNQESGFDWEIVPHKDSCFPLIKLMQVAWRVFFGGIALDESKRQQIAAEYAQASEFFNSPLVKEPFESQKSQDAFCREKVIESQKIIDEPNKCVRVLYDYRPLAPNHFLVVIKDHKEKFTDISQNDYLEASEYTQKLIQNYGTKGSTYLFHKTGRAAGQSIPHWHLHVVLPNNSQEEWFGRMRLLINMVWGTSPLKPQELQSRVGKLRDALTG